MAKLTIVFGVLLVAVGIWGYVDTGSAHPTALIPAYIGLVLVIAGALAIAPARRMLWMHIAVTVGLLGFLATVKGGIDTFGSRTAPPSSILSPSSKRVRPACSVSSSWHFVCGRLSRQDERGC